MARRFVLSALALAALVLAAAGAFNYAIDPYQQYRVPTRYEARFYAPFQRYVNPGLARHRGYDRISIGSSLTENISGSEIDRAFGGGRTINLALSAMTAYDARKLLEVALRRGGVKQVLFTLDYNGFSGAPDRTGFPDPLPTYLYDEALWNDYPYLLSIATLRKSLEIVAGRKVNRFSTDADRPWAWDGTSVFSAREVVRGLDPADLNKRFRQPPRTLEAMMASFEANVLPIVRANPQTEFIFIWPPYSVLVWADFAQRGQLEVSLAFKRRSFELLRAFPNARVHDFQGRHEVIEHLDFYKDIYHYGPVISSALMRWVAAGEDRLTAENLEERIARQREIALGVDPARVIAAARR